MNLNMIGDLEEQLHSYSEGSSEGAITQMVSQLLNENTHWTVFSVQFYFKL